jgi:cytochrome c oxidase subunit IV
MGHGKDLGYSVGKVFAALFVLTAIEVAFGLVPFLREPRVVLWSGLIVCMLAKGLLIFMYFMHMRFERWIVWSLIGPTPLLVAVVLFANMPDTAFNDQRDFPVGYRIDATGKVFNAVHPGAEHPASASEVGGGESGH